MANIKAIMEKLSKLTDENEKLYKENVKVKRERDNLDLILVGVMHSVDKWLTDEEKYGKDEVNRGIAMREKTLRIVEDLIADKEKLKKENTELTERNKELCSNINELRGQMVARRTVHPDIQNKCDRLKKENSELKSKLENGIEVEITAGGNGYVVIEAINDIGNNLKAGTYRGKVVIEE